MRKSLTNRLAERAAAADISFLPEERRQRLKSIVAKLYERRESVIGYAEYANQPGIDSFEFGEPHQYQLESPSYANQVPEDITERIGTHICDQSTVVMAECATLIADTDAKITDDGKYLVYNLGRTSSKDYAHTRMAEYFMMELEKGNFLPISPGKYGGSADIECGISLLNPRGRRNYSHWVAHCLPLLEGAYEYEVRTGQRPRVIIPEDPPQFVTESLAALGYDESSQVEMTKPRLTVKTLLVPSERYCDVNGFPGSIHDISGLEWVRNQIQNKKGADSLSEPEYAGHQILISRADTDRRRIVNHDEVLTVLERRGFKQVVLSDLSFMEQFSLFRDANTIVGVHGAGLANIIFAKRAKLLELYGEHFNPEFYEFAELSGHQYGCLRCQQRGEDVFVDIGELTQALDNL